MADCELEYSKKEYAIVGDNVFFSGLNSIPSWLEEYIKNLTYTTIYELYAGYSGGLWDSLGLANILSPSTNIFDISIDLLNALRSLEVAKNDYKFYVDKKITDDMAYVATLETLNANIGNNDATIKNLQLTYADRFMAVATQISLLTAATATATGEIASIHSAIATETGALAQRIDALVTNYTDLNTKATATATATDSLYTYTGTLEGTLTATAADVTILESTIYNPLTGLTANATAISELKTKVTENADGIISQASNITGIKAVLRDANGVELVGSGNTVGSYVSTAVNANGLLIANYALYANVNRIFVNGEPYLSGYGAYAEATPPYYIPTSKFWVAADEFMVYPSSTLTGPSAESNIKWQEVQVYDPVSRTYTTQKLVKSIKNALPVFGINTVTSKIKMSADVEINGSLVVNGTITANEIQQGSAGYLTSYSYPAHSAQGANGMVEIASIQIPSTSIVSGVVASGAILLEFSGYIDATEAIVELTTNSGGVLVSRSYTVPYNSDGGATSKIGSISIRNLQPYDIRTSPIFRVKVSLGATGGVYSWGTIYDFILSGTVIKR